MEHVIGQIAIGLTEVIATLVAVIVVLNKRLGKNADTGGSISEDIGKVYSAINKNRDDRQEHCATQLEKCNAEFKQIAVNNASIETKLEAIGNDLREVKTLIKNGNK